MHYKLSQAFSLLSKLSDRKNINIHVKEFSRFIHATMIRKADCGTVPDIIDLTVDTPGDEPPRQNEGTKENNDNCIVSEKASSATKNMAHQLRKPKSGSSVGSEKLPEYISIIPHPPVGVISEPRAGPSKIQKRDCHTTSSDRPKKQKSPKKVAPLIKVEKEIQVSDSDEEFDQPKGPIHSPSNENTKKQELKNLSNIKWTGEPSGKIPNTSLKPQNWRNIEYQIHISDEALVRRRTYEQNRPWMYLDDSESQSKYAKHSNNCPFTVLSYNVLAPSIIPNTMFLYTDCSQQALSWHYRWHLFQYEIRQANPDVVTLQEVDSNLYETHYLPWFTHNGFQGLYKKRTHGRNDGCAIFYRSSQFRLVESCSVEYFQPHGGRSLDRDNIGLIAKLSPLSFDAPFCVITTHLLYNPNRHDVRLAQMALLLAEMDRICYVSGSKGNVKYCPSILTGDFNTTPKSDVIELLSTGRVDQNVRSNAAGFYSSHLINPVLGITKHCKHFALEQNRYKTRGRNTLFSLYDQRQIEEDLLNLFHSDKPEKYPRYTNVPRIEHSGFQSLYHSFPFRSVYDISSNCKVTTRHGRWLTVDYMFYTVPHQRQNVSLKLAGFCKLPDSEQANSYGPLPSDICPSDHFPLGARFVLTNTHSSS